MVPGYYLGRELEIIKNYPNPPVKSGESGIPEAPCFIMWYYGRLDDKD